MFYKNSSGDKSSLDDRINSNSTHGSYVDTYSYLTSSSQPSHRHTSNTTVNSSTANTTASSSSSSASSSTPTHHSTHSKQPTYKLIRCIGFGGYGRVYEAVRSDDSLPVIIKLIPKSGIVNWSSKQFSALYHNNSSSSSSSSSSSTTSSRTSGSQHQLAGSSVPGGPAASSTSTSTSAYLPFEIECLIRLRDTPGVVKIYDFFEEATCFVIVMEKLTRCMTLFDMCNGKPFSFTHSILRRIFIQLIRINLALFAKGIVHRDIKPENILVNLDDYMIKLIDFGSAANFRGRGEPFREFQGTLECMPPEWILNGMYESEQATAWSIGVTFYFSVFGRYPFRNKQNIISGKFPLPYSNVNNDLLQFLDCCFQMNPSKRFLLQQLLGTPWLKRYERP